MRPEIEELKALHTQIDDFEASEFVANVLREEIDQLRHLSHHGTFHEYVKQKGYPLPLDHIRASSYLRRPYIEKRLRNSLSRGNHVILVGCEGSGKTTLIHYVVGTLINKNIDTVLYIDTSDIEGTDDLDMESIVFRKISGAINRVSNTEIGKSFESWAKIAQDDIFLRSLIDLGTVKGLAEAFIVYLRTQDTTRRSYIILDNLDSLSIHANKVLFSALNRIDETVSAVANRLEVQDRRNVRFVISCRTPTYRHMSGTALGLFLNFPHDEIQVEDDFLNKTNLIDLMRRFLLNKDGRAHREISKKVAHIRLDQYSITSGLDEYFSDVLNWLSNHEKIFNRTIKMFCGRSIRRAKLYSLKVLGSAIVARLTTLEKYGAVSITPHDKRYLSRRILESIFDFQTYGSVGFPMNPFRVVSDEMEFRGNPLIGIVAIFYLSDNRKEINDEKIFFASSVSVEGMVKYLSTLGYSDAAIREFFVAARESGLLRPVQSSNVLIADAVTEYRSVHSTYVIDDTALEGIVGLLSARDPEMSIIFFNSATRARYMLGGPRRIDNLLGEAFTTLVFLSDFLDRERQLEKMAEGSGIMITVPSSRFQSKLIPMVSGILRTFKNQSSNLRRTSYEEHLKQEAERLFGKIRREMRLRSSII